MASFKKPKSRQNRKERRKEFAAPDREREGSAAPERSPFNPKKLFNPSKIQAKSENQQRYIDSLDRNTVTFGLGPAGSGKTHVAVAKAAEAYESEDVRRIVFIRPHLGLGKTMGFQPGDLVAKMSHYLRPLFDALAEFYPVERIKRMMEQADIEVAALEFIRGRTLKNSFVILDEAQNATFDEMKSFLTRLGEGSRYVITGDITRGPDGRLEQSDLNPREQGALEYYANRFYDLPGVDVVPMTVADVVRHPLVKLMLERGF